MNRMFIGCFSAVLVLASVKTVSAQKYIEECAKALTATDIASKDDLAATYAYLSTKLQNMESTGDIKGTLSVPIDGVPVGMSYSEAKTKKEQLSERLGVKWDVRHAQSYAAKYVSASSNSTFGQCIRDMLRKNDPVQIEITASEENYANIKVHIGSEPAAQGNLELVLLSDGQFSHGVQRRWTIGGGTTSVTVRRTNPGRDLFLTAQIRNGDNELGSDEIVIPPIITTTSRTTTVERVSDASLANCGGVRGRANPGSGNTVAMAAGPGEQFNVGEIVEEQVAEVVGKPGYNLIPGQQYRIDFLTKSPSNIVFQAWCSIWADERYSWSGRVRVPAVRTAVAVHVPPDTGAGGIEERAPPATP